MTWFKSPTVPALTHHALIQATARRIGAEALLAVLDYGSEYRSCGDRFLRMDRKALRRAKSMGVDLRAYEGVTAVLSWDGPIKTTYRNRSGRRMWR